MKRLLLLVTLIVLGITDVSAAVSFSNALANNDNKPMAVLVYADWADGYQNALLQFRRIQKSYGTSFDFVELNITKKEAKEYSDRFKIMAGLPYVMLYKTKCKKARYLDKKCTASYSCVDSKMQTFIK